MPPVIFIDIRSLQDPNYQYRGVGFHVSSLLRSRRTTACAPHHVVGLVDANLPPVPPLYAELVDKVSSCWNPPVLSHGAVFLDMSPMTHPATLGFRFVSGSLFFKAAVIYDYIPLDWPGYFPTLASRIDYFSKVVRLRGFDAYFPISAYSGWRTESVVGADPSQIVVTGASVRNALYEIRAKMTPSVVYFDRSAPYFVTVGGGDRRKNTETAVAAVRQLNQLGYRIGLKVVGHYGPDYKDLLLQMAGHEEGAGFLELHPGITDESLVALYAGAIASIAPSHIEGFSLPVVESAVCGTPVIASSCGAQLELVEHPEALFQSSNPEELCKKLRALLDHPERRDHLLRSQSHLGTKFHEDRVGARLWNALAERLDRRFPSCVPSVLKKCRPKLAVLSPYPPERSGVARYTERTLQAASAEFDVDLYTNAPRPIFSGGHFHDAGTIGKAVLLRGKYDAIVSVLGNSEYHTPIFEVFEEYGGPCILHDSRLAHVYHARYGHQRFVRHAESLLGRSVADEEVTRWLQDKDPPTLFVEPVILRAQPLIVHTVQYQKLLERQYGVSAQVTTFCPNMSFDETELTAQNRAAARARLGIEPGVFLISTFGYVAPVKAPEICVIATELLRAWGIPAELHFVGDPVCEAGNIERIARYYGIAPSVRTMSTFVDMERYREYMLASDAAIQLRTYGFGQPSAALTDCISAALPCVATEELALSCDSPNYVLAVPDRTSPLQLAEQLALIHEDHRDRSSNTPALRSYLSTHNFEFYAKRLREILGSA